MFFSFHIYEFQRMFNNFFIKHNTLHTNMDQLAWSNHDLHIVMVNSVSIVLINFDYIFGKRNTIGLNINT